MGELVPRPEGEIVHEAEAELDYERILAHLLRIAEQKGIEADEEDLRLILGEDNNDFLGGLTSWAWANEIDHEDLFIELGVPAELVIQFSDPLEITDGQLEIVDGTEYTEENTSKELE